MGNNEEIIESVVSHLKQHSTSNEAGEQSNQADVVPPAAQPTVQAGRILKRRSTVLDGIDPSNIVGGRLRDRLPPFQENVDETLSMAFFTMDGELVYFKL